ncbi:hypothetical protein SDC9_95346 [bioreactor metagenome]|uniref:Uncharacterized protein n=1 Tax=bioreactor metagenome TaxID=1076179 RepID=A0A645A617_9ZZZZ
MIKPQVDPGLNKFQCLTDAHFIDIFVFAADVVGQPAGAVGDFAGLLKDDDFTVLPFSHQAGGSGHPAGIAADDDNLHHLSSSKTGR